MDGEAPAVVIGTAHTTAYDLESGETRWEYGAPTEAELAAAAEGNGRRRSGVISSPVFHDGILLASTGSRGGVFRALRVDAGGPGLAPPGGSGLRTQAPYVLFG
jgi:hypothetical protein